MHNIALIINKLQGGGAERCAADLSIYFTQRGFQVFIFTDLSIKVEYEYAGMLVNYSSTTDNVPGDHPISCKVDELKGLKREYKIDIAISFMQIENHFNILSKTREKVVLTTHSVNSRYEKSGQSVFWTEEAFRDLYQYADLITFPSEYCRQDWIEHYGDKNHITRTVYNPVHAMDVEGDDVKENIIIAIGRMQSIKRQWHIIRAFKMVKEKCPDSRLIILGDGELRTKQEELIQKLGLESDIELPGNVTNVQDYLKKAKVLAITSRLEAFPCSVLEAFSAGVPVVACDCPGGIREELNLSCEQGDITEPIQGECGVLVPYIKEFYTEQFTKEEIMLAEEIIKLLRNDELRVEMGRNARRRAETFSMEQIGRVWTEELLEINLGQKGEIQGFDEEKQKRIRKLEAKENTNVKMYISYYRLLEKWMLLREKRISINRYFEKNGISNIIIYGMGKMTHHLLEDLKDSEINIVCAIDRGAFAMNNEFPIISGEADIPEADCIIVTPVYDIDTIKQRLDGKTVVPIISLSEIVNDCLT